MVMKSLMTDENQAKLQQVIDDNAPTKIVHVAKKSSKAKDPEKPKRGSSSYIFFCKDARAEIKEEFPEMKGKEITVEMGKRWKLLSDKKKKKYIKLAEKDKEPV